MKALSWLGMLLVVLGIVSLFVAIPQRERHGVNAGGVSMGIETRTSEKVSPAVSAVLIVAGAGLLVAGRRRTA
jgi:hypothetical protein